LREYFTPIAVTASPRDSWLDPASSGTRSGRPCRVWKRAASRGRTVPRTAEMPPPPGGTPTHLDRAWMLAPLGTDLGILDRWKRGAQRTQSGSLSRRPIPALSGPLKDLSADLRTPAVRVASPQRDVIAVSGFISAERGWMRSILLSRT